MYGRVHSPLDSGRILTFLESTPSACGALLTVRWLALHFAVERHEDLAPFSKFDITSKTTPDPKHAVRGFVVHMIRPHQRVVTATRLLLALLLPAFAQLPTGRCSAAASSGDSKRGALVFHRAELGCSKCHLLGRKDTIGPDLTSWPEKVTDAFLREAIIEPSKHIRKGYETTTVVTVDGKIHTGLLAGDADDEITLRDPSTGKLTKISVGDIEERVTSKLSAMPKGLANLISKQELDDLVQYLIEIRDGGMSRARELEPPAALLVTRPVPEYEKRIDHAGIIRDLDREAFARGAEIYRLICQNCHGTIKQPGSLPTSLRFAEGKFKNGSDLHSMYRTVTHGFGMMVRQDRLVPVQKYDVLFYIQEHFIKPHNPSQFRPVTDDYLAGLPSGDSRGPKPRNLKPWEQMDYGPSLTRTWEIGSDARNFAYKGIAMRLDPGAGGVSRGQHWMIFDEDTLRVAAAWSDSQKRFIDWNGIDFNGQHAVHPRIVGDIAFENVNGPGWKNPHNDSWDDPRVVGRDNRLYGPLPRDWAHLKGIYYHGERTAISYSVGETSILETPGQHDGPIFTRSLLVGKRPHPLVLQVARPRETTSFTLHRIENAVLFGPPPRETELVTGDKTIRFDGQTYLEVSDADAIDLFGHSFTVRARIKAQGDGTIFRKALPTGRWTPNGQSLFIRGGRLTFDIGWVGAVSGETNIADKNWHDVAMTWNQESGHINLYVDGKLDGSGRMRSKAPLDGAVVKLGYTSPNFPSRNSHFKGAIDTIEFYSRELAPDEFTGQAEVSPLARWQLENQQGDAVPNQLAAPLTARVIRGQATGDQRAAPYVLAGLASDVPGLEWAIDAGRLVLNIPAGDTPLNFTIWQAGLDDIQSARTIVAAIDGEKLELDPTWLTSGGPSRWPQAIDVPVQLDLYGDAATGPFAVDVLQHPEQNPWSCRNRLTGHDFTPDGNTAYVTAWDGDVWKVDGLLKLDDPGANSQDPPTLRWKRICSGLFQPLGIKLVQGKLYVSCRDMIAILHDLNGDEEIDYVENFNNDHQVTEHFHEFAMGLQVDDSGNFYYAKSARHAKTALVPHHGTLLKVSPDGETTEILATGFRAANGVCLNPDGSFVVTDQEGHWNPKNRINWVRPGGFYGNMYGYHDVTDSSDSAMDQPLCWITNSFDRSPSELLWVDSPKWGELDGTLLNLSYGYGQVYTVPHEEVLVDGEPQMQGGMCAFPLPKFPTGTMRGRFHPVDQQLYLSGMFAWAGNQQENGGFFRLRRTDNPVHLPIGLHARRNGMAIRFSGELDPSSVDDLDRFAVKTWSLKRTANYGSKHYDEKPLDIASVHLSEDRRELFLELPEIAPTWCMEIRYAVQTSNGETVTGTIHNTIHSLGD